jgi:hypothetical protein
LGCLKQVDGEEALFDRAFAILESMASVKSCVLTAEIAISNMAKNTPNPDKLLIMLFKMLFSIFSVNTSKKIEEYTIEIMTSCIDELSFASVDFLTVLLSPLLMCTEPSDLGESRADIRSTSRSHDVSFSVLQRANEKLFDSIANAVHGWLMASLLAFGGHVALQQQLLNEDKKKKGGINGEEIDGDSYSSGNENELTTLFATIKEASSKQVGDGLAGDQSAWLNWSNISKVVVEVIPALPSILSMVLPSLITEARVESDLVRKHATSLLGRIFSLTITIPMSINHAPTVISTPTGSGTTASASNQKLCIGKVFNSQFNDWLQRSQDKSVEIRLIVANYCRSIFLIHESLQESISKRLEKFLVDSDESVRILAVEIVSDIGVVNFSKVSTSLFDALVNRVNDKSIRVRRDTLTGLAQIFAAHVPKIWSSIASHNVSFKSSIIGDEYQKATKRMKFSNSNSFSKNISAPLMEGIPCYQLDISSSDILERMRVVPSNIVRAYEQPEGEIKVRVTQLLDSILFPDFLTLEARSFGLIWMFSTLTDDLRLVFEAIQHDRMVLQLKLSSLLAARTEYRSSLTSVGFKSTSDSIDEVPVVANAKKQVSIVIKAIASQFSNPDAISKSLEYVTYQINDNKVFKDLQLLSSTESSFEGIKSARKDLFERLNRANSVASASLKVTSKKVTAEESNGTLKPLVDSIRELVRKSAMTLVTNGMLPWLFYFALCSLSQGNSNLAKDAVRLILLFAKKFPGLFDTSAEVDVSKSQEVSDTLYKLITVLDVDQSGIAIVELKVSLLRIISTLGQKIFKLLPSTVTNELQTVMSQLLVTSGSFTKLSKHGMKCILILWGNDEVFMNTVLRSLNEALFSIDEGMSESTLLNAPSVLAAVGSLALFAPRKFKMLDLGHEGRVVSHLNNLVVSFGSEDILSSQETVGKKKSQSHRPRLKSIEEEEVVSESHDSTKSPVSSAARSIRSTRSNVDYSESNRDEVDADVIKPKKLLHGMNSSERVKHSNPICGYKGIPASLTAGIRIGALKALTCIPRGLFAMDSDNVDSVSAEIISRGALIAGLISRILGCGGSVQAPFPTTECQFDIEHGSNSTTRMSSKVSEYASQRLAALICLLKLASISNGAFDSRIISVPCWLACTQSCFDIHPIVRSKLVETVSNLVQTGNLPIRYVVLLTFCSLDPRPTQKRECKESLALSVNKLRGIVHFAQINKHPIPQQFMPEYILCMVIFALAHDESRFPLESDVKSWRRVESKQSTLEETDCWSLFHAPIFSAYFDAILQDSAKVTPIIDPNSSISLMFAILERIRLCQDAVTPESKNIIYLADLAFLLLKKRAKDKAAFAPYQGTVRLPLSLYKASK